MNRLLLLFLTTPLVAAAAAPALSVTIVDAYDQRFPLSRRRASNFNLSGVWAGMLQGDPTLTEIPILDKNLSPLTLNYFMTALRNVDQDVASHPKRLTPYELEFFVGPLAKKTANIDVNVLPDLIMLAHKYDSPILERAFIKNFVRTNQPMGDFPEPVRNLIEQYKFLKNPRRQTNVTVPFYMLYFYDFFPRVLKERYLAPIFDQLSKNSNTEFRLAEINGTLLKHIARLPNGPRELKALSGVLRLPGIDVDAGQALLVAVVRNNLDAVELLLNAGAQISDELLAITQERVDKKLLNPAILETLLVVSQQRNEAHALRAPLSSAAANSKLSSEKNLKK